MQIMPVDRTMMTNTNASVVPCGKFWEVEQVGTYPCFISQNKVDAVAYGIELARAAGVELTIHGQNGRFQDVRDYRYSTHV